jgi:HPt (histidine-containing phosphotransfer) domain-containing protein
MGPPARDRGAAGEDREYDATSRLRTAGYAGPIVALTARAMAEDRARCLQSGCSDYLAKPVNRNHLIQTLSRHLPGPPPLHAAAAAIVQGPAPSRPGRLHGDLATDGDTELAMLLNRFIADLPRQVSALLRITADADLAALSGIAHQIKGTGGLYGFSRISDAAEALERRLNAADDVRAADGELRRLIEIIRDVGGYDLAREQAAAPATETANEGGSCHTC